MTSPDDFIRSFGMSGYLITDDLKKLEQRFSIDLGHTPKAETASAVAYYPQFEQAVRAAAAEMSQHYEVFYCLEQAIRKLITETLQDAEGIDWWKSGRISQDIAAAAAGLEQKERDSGI